MRTAEQIAREVMDACFSWDNETVRSLLHPEYSFVGPDGVTETDGTSWLMEQLKIFQEAMPDVTWEGTYYPISDTICIIEGVMIGTQTGEFNGIPPSNKQVRLREIVIIECRDGLVWQEREYYDGLPYLKQLGVGVEATIGGTLVSL